MFNLQIQEHDRKFYRAWQTEEIRGLLDELEKLLTNREKDKSKPSNDKPSLNPPSKGGTV